MVFTHLPSLLLFVVGIGALLLPLARQARNEREKRDPERAYLGSHVEGVGTLAIPALVCAGFLFSGMAVWSLSTL